jgi:NAD(P)-dependent dehydrogenase (short-subunit alcohol dehydrogenase family)
LCAIRGAQHSRRRDGARRHRRPAAADCAQRRRRQRTGRSLGERGGWVPPVTDSTFFRRHGGIDEQVAPILFLASDDASYITGTVLPVAGGDTSRRCATCVDQFA